MSVAVTKRAVFVMLSFKNVFIQNSIVQFQKLLLRQIKTSFDRIKPFICLILKWYEVSLAKSCSVIVINVLLRSWIERNEREQKEEKLCL